MQVFPAKIAVAETFSSQIMDITPRGKEQLPEQDSSSSILPENYFDQKSKPKSNPGHLPQQGFRSHRCNVI